MERVRRLGVVSLDTFISIVVFTYNTSISTDSRRG
jgi:hypothetical protein